MGIVYRARDQREQRDVALKFMLSEVQENPEVVSRFLREARIAASIESEHVVRIFEVAKHQDEPFIVMELLSGEALSVPLRKGQTKRAIEASEAEAGIRTDAGATVNPRDAGKR
jgi:serine/threonine protein kinase